MDTCIAADVFVQHKENYGTELAFASPCSQAWAQARRDGGELLMALLGRDASV